MSSMKTSSRTFYKRVLPPSCTAFSSKRGKEIFGSAMKGHGLKSFFALMEQHTTQSEPSYCGIATLVVVLNAFAVDPRQAWKGPWRWYHDEMLNCCLDMEEVKKTGITLPNFACLAICQGISADVRYASSEQGSLEEFRKAVQKACVDNPKVDVLNANVGSDDDSGESLRDILVVSYHRGILGQTGTGHFSPIAAYDADSDSVLILDTARFKYGAHWVSLPLLHSAMMPEDPETGKSRGFVLLSRTDDTFVGREDYSNHIDGTDSQVSFLVQYKFNTEARQIVVDFRKFWNSQLNGGVTWLDVYNYWTRNGLDFSFIWNVVVPQCRPNDLETMNLAEQVIELIRQLLTFVSQTHANRDERETPPGFCESNGICGPNRGRAIPISSTEAIFIVFLATLSKEEQKQKVESASGTTEAKEKLLAAADLIQKVMLHTEL